MSGVACGGETKARDGDKDSDGRSRILTRMSLADRLGSEQEALSVLHLVGGASVGVSVSVSVCLRHLVGWKGERGIRNDGFCVQRITSPI